MLTWLLHPRMQGGLVFGPPGWMPPRIEETFDAPPEPYPAPPPRPTDRTALAKLLKSLALPQTSPLIPGLVEQFKELGTNPLAGVILNLLPTQPESALASALTQLALSQVLEGLITIGTACSAKRCLVPLDRHDFALWRTLRRGLRARPPKDRATLPIKLRPLLNRYPQGDPTLLMWALLGRRLPVGQLPTTRGWIIVDAVTCWALGRHLVSGETFTRRPVQLFVQGAEPRLVMARIGETVSDFCRRHGITSDLSRQQLIVNGMLTGTLVSPSAKITSHTEALTLRDVPAAEPSTSCISCGWCVDVCPTALTPVRLMQTRETLSLLDDARAQRLLATKTAREAQHCIACGLCSYVCPTRLPLTEQVLDLRSMLIKRGDANAA